MWYSSVLRTQSVISHAILSLNVVSIVIVVVVVALCVFTRPCLPTCLSSYPPGSLRHVTWWARLHLPFACARYVVTCRRRSHVIGYGCFVIRDRSPIFIYRSHRCGTLDLSRSFPWKPEWNICLNIFWLKIVSFEFLTFYFATTKNNRKFPCK